MVIAKLNIISIFRYVNYILKFGYLLFGSGSKKFWFGFSVPEIKDPFRYMFGYMKFDFILVFGSVW